MSLLVVDNLHSHIASLGTSGDGVLQRVRDLVIGFGGKLITQGTASTESQSFWVGERATAEQTNSGLVAVDTTPSAAISELRHRSGLTWDQLARLFGVTRRSVHFWASGKALNAANEERLGRILTVVRYIDRGSAKNTRAALFTALNDGVIPFDLLAGDQFEELKERLGAGRQGSRPALPPLSADAQIARTPRRPDERVGAIHNTVHREVGRSRAARTVKTKNNR